MAKPEGFIIHVSNCPVTFHTGMIIANAQKKTLKKTKRERKKEKPGTQSKKEEKSGKGPCETS